MDAVDEAQCVSVAAPDKLCEIDADCVDDIVTDTDQDTVDDAEPGVGMGKEALGDTLPVDVGVYAFDITVALDVGDCAVCDAGADALSDGDADRELLAHTLTVALPVVEPDAVAHCDAVVHGEKDPDTDAVPHADIEGEGVPRAGEGDCVAVPHGDGEIDGVPDPHMLAESEGEGEAVSECETVVDSVTDGDCVAVVLGVKVGEPDPQPEPDCEGVADAHCETDALGDPHDENVAVVEAHCDPVCDSDALAVVDCD